jgi:predicted GNAT family N-acyltransferase
VSTFEVRVADWSADRESIRSIRERVFIDEQAVPREIEWDGLDPGSLHVLAETPNRDAIGTGRLQQSGKIGRMAVLRPWRGRQVGSKILACLLEAARSQGIVEVYLHAQTQAANFYAGFGFEAEGDEFQEAGIPHRLMKRRVELD